MTQVIIRIRCDGREFCPEAHQSIVDGHPVDEAIGVARDLAAQDGWTVEKWTEAGSGVDGVVDLCPKCSR